MRLFSPNVTKLSHSKWCVEPIRVDSMSQLVGLLTSCRKGRTWEIIRKAPTKRYAKSALTHEKISIIASSHFPMKSLPWLKYLHDFYLHWLCEQDSDWINPWSPQSYLGWSRSWKVCYFPARDRGFPFPLPEIKSKSTC